MQAGNFDRYDTRGKETVIPTGNTVVYEGMCWYRQNFKYYDHQSAMKRAGLIDLLFFYVISTIGGEISLSDLFILFIFGRFRPQFHKNCKKVKK